MSIEKTTNNSLVAELMKSIEKDMSQFHETYRLHFADFSAHYYSNPANKGAGREQLLRAYEIAFPKGKGKGPAYDNRCKAITGKRAQCKNACSKDKPTSGLCSVHLKHGTAKFGRVDNNNSKGKEIEQPHSPEAPIVENDTPEVIISTPEVVEILNTVVNNNDESVQEKRRGLKRRVQA